MNKWLRAVCVLCLFAGAALAQNPFNVSLLGDEEQAPATAYNFIEDEFLVVWQSAGHKIHGRLYFADGTPRTDPFSVFEGGTSCLMPDVAYSRVTNEYMVVWEDWRRELSTGADVFGIRLNKDGMKIHSPRSEPDTSFAICDNDSAQGHPKIAHNYNNNVYMVVWHDNRHNYRYDMPEWAIYGQRLDWNANLLPPLESPSTKENQMIGSDMDYQDKYPDIAYHGGMGSTLNEFMVVWQRFFSMEMMNNCRIWAARVKGNNGKMLDSYGFEYDPGNTAKPSGGPPWWEDMPVSVDSEGFWGMGAEYIDGSPHIWSNDYVTAVGKASDAHHRYTVPEFMVSWSSYVLGWDNPDIMVQRMAFFPDSAAYRLGIKNPFSGDPVLGPDSNWVCVPLDTAGNWANPPWEWINWAHYAACSHTGYQSWNDLTFNQEAEEFVVVWNDWRAMGSSGYPMPPADIYGQHLFIDAADSSLKWTDPQGNYGHDPAVNTPIATTPGDEGGGTTRYPCIAYGPVENQFLVGYGFDENNDDMTYAVYGVMHTGAIPTAVEIKPVMPEVFLLVENYPNPFNPETVIRCRLPRRAETVVEIFDVRGRLVCELGRDVVEAGTVSYRWHAAGQPSGVYICRVKNGADTAVIKMLLLR